MNATKEEEDIIREMKRSRDYRKWVSLSNEIDWKMAELKEKERRVEDKLMQDYNIKRYTKDGLFRSGRYGNLKLSFSFNN